jgi:hypothetical protein
MAKLFLKEVALIFVVWVVYKQVRNWLRWRALKKFGDDHGCGAALALPNKLPGGLERLWFLFTGAKGERDNAFNFSNACFSGFR